MNNQNKHLDVPAEDIIKAHQYLYYVRCTPVLSDAEYDQLCVDCGIDGSGGSSLECDYKHKIVSLAAYLAAVG